jgi:hypothetical protein
MEVDDLPAEVALPGTPLVPENSDPPQGLPSPLPSPQL